MDVINSYFSLLSNLAVSHQTVRKKVRSLFGRKMPILEVSFAILPQKHGLCRALLSY